MRTRAEMEELIRKGNTVGLPDGRRIARIEDLPSESVLAAGDRDRLQAEHDRLSGIVEDHQKQLATVERQLKAAERSTADATKTAAAGGGDDAAFMELTAEDLHKLAAKNKVDVPAHATKAEVAAALTAKGVKPPK
jgi:hypothetical protein